MSDNKSYSCSEVAKMLGDEGVRILNEFESGRIEGYRRPGTEDRRIPAWSVKEYCEREGLPIPAEIAAEEPADPEGEEEAFARAVSNFLEDNGTIFCRMFRAGASRAQDEDATLAACDGDARRIAQQTASYSIHAACYRAGFLHAYKQLDKAEFVEDTL